jgi:hypothetical protein
MRYLTLQYLHKPNGQIDESMTVTNRLRTNDWQCSSVILDFREQKVLKATVDGNNIPKDWEHIVGYYYEHYAATFERLLVENGHVLDESEKQTDPS